MRARILSYLLCTLPVLAQIEPKTVVATINGTPLTAQEAERLIAILGSRNEQAAAAKPKDLLSQHALLQRLLKDAADAKLETKSPHKERIEEARRQILSQAAIREKTSQLPIDPEDQKKAYESGLDNYREARVKVIFISRASLTQSIEKPGQIVETVTEDQARLKANSLASQARKGADFVALAKKHSDDGSVQKTDGNYPIPIRTTTDSVPLEIRTPLMAAKAGEIVGPLEHATGFYIFRIDSMDVVPYSQVKDEIYRELQEAAARQWLDEAKAQSFKVENEEFFAAPQK